MRDDSFRVIAAKSAAGVRVVPIHTKLQRPVEWRWQAVWTHEDGDGLRADVCIPARKCFVTLLENAGVSENVVAELVGHEKPRITYGLYLGGATLEVKRAALAKLAYPTPG